MWLGGQAVHLMEPGPENGQFGRDGSQQPIQFPRHGSQGASILRLVGVSQTGVQGIQVRHI